MDGAAFRPTHRTPDAGLPAWDAPDPTEFAAHRLDPELPVEVLEETTGWAHVRCSNDWETWVDATRLVALPFRPTHVVPAGGLDAREEPEASRPPDARLDSGLPVEVADEALGWARVRCSNRWEAWIDGRSLVPIAAEPLTVRADSLGLGGALATLGIPATVVAVGSFLAWLSVGGEDATAWDVEVVGLVTHRASSFDLKTGPVLLALALVALAGMALVLARPVPRAATIVVGVAGALAFGLGALGVILYLDLPEPRPGLGIGVLLTMAGGLALAAGGFLAPTTAAHSRDDVR